MIGLFADPQRNNWVFGVGVLRRGPVLWAVLALFAVLMPSAHAGTASTVRTWIVPASAAKVPPTVQNTVSLPSEISLDELLAAEVAQFKQGILNDLGEARLPRVDGIAGCMQWLFVRHTPQGRWMPVGFSLPHYAAGAIKLNGALRSAKFIFDIAPHSRNAGRWVGELMEPGRRPGEGAVTVTSFAPRGDFSAWKSALPEVRKATLDGLGGTAMLGQRILHLAPVSKLRVADPSMRCSLMAAQCRRYVSSVDDAAEWRGPIEAPAGAGSPTQTTAEPVRLSKPLAAMELAIEDMCAFSRLALVERPLNTRVDPVEVGIGRFGFAGNADLKSALQGN